MYAILLHSETQIVPVHEIKPVHDGDVIIQMSACEKDCIRGTCA